MNKSFYATFAWPIIIAVVVLLPFTVWAAILALLSNKNDVKEWLPDTFQATQDYRRFGEHFGDETFVLVSWPGATLDDPRVEQLVERLLHPPAGQPHYYAKAATGAGLVERLMNAPTNLSQTQAIRRLEGTLVGPDGKQTCAALTLNDNGREHLRKAVAAVYQATAALGIPRHEVRMGGPPVDNVAIDEAGEQMLIQLMGLCGAVGLGLAFWYLRDWRLTLIALVGGIYSAGICLALVWLLGGRMSSILLSMPAVVYTAGLATAMHLINYYRHVRMHGELAGAVARTVHAAWLPCTLSAGTTALGLVSLYISDLVPIKTFGLFTALGVMATVGFMFLYLPAALQLWPPRMPPGTDDEDSLLSPDHRRRMRGMGSRVVAHSRWVWAAFLLLIVGCGSGLFRAETTINLMSLFSPDAEIIQSYLWLEKELGPLVPMEIVIHFDTSRNDQTLVQRMRLVEAVQEAAESIPEVGGTMSAVTFVPDLKPRRAGLLLTQSAYENVLNRRLAAHRQELVDEGYVSEDRQTHEELWRVSLRVAALADIDYGAFIDDIRRHVGPIIAGEREEGVRGLAVTYTGMTPVVYMAERALLNGLVQSFFGAFVMIAAVMTLVFRDVRAGLLTMLPNVFPMTVVFGLMSWLGIALDIGTMMTASVAMGVCVDDTVHFASWFRRGVRMGMSRRDAVVTAYEHSAGAIYQSTAIVAFGLLTFALSTFMPTRRFGVLMFTLLGCGLVADLALTPVILSGRFGRYFTRLGWRRRAGEQAPEQSPEEDVYV